MAVTFTQARKSTCNLGELVSFSGGFSPLDTSGLMPFEGTVTVLAKNRDGFCWGQKVIITVEGMGTGWLPELYIKSVSPLDIKTGEISVNVGCVISLLSNKTFDDFKEEEDFLIDAETGETGPAVRYWWQQWELLQADIDAGIIKDVTITSIVQEMCRHLNLPCSGGVAGKKRLPYTPSGNILSEIGNLIFNSESPSYAYSDHRGGIRITPIDFTPNNGFSITLGQSELDKDYNPVDGGVEPIKRLVVTYTLQELEAECDKTVQRCYTASTSLPGLTITGDVNDQYELTVETDTTCEWVTCGVSGGAVGAFSQNECNVKAIEIKKKARPEYLFPGYKPGVFGPDFVDSYYELKNEYYDAEEGILRGEATLIQEPVGIVYSGWINSHEHWEIEEAGGTGSSINDFPNNIAIGLGAVYPATLPTGRAGHPRNKYNTTLTNSSYTETKYFYNDSLILTGKVTTTWMPISKALPDFNGNSFNGTGTAKVEFDPPADNKSQYSQYSIEILEKDQWVDLSSITGSPDPTDLTGKVATFLIYGDGDGRGTKAFSGETVITSIVTETWDYSCSGGSRHQVEEKVLKYEYASEIESNLQSKYAEPINAILNITTFTKVDRPAIPATPTSPGRPAIPAGGIIGESKSTITTDTPTGFITVPMWGTRQQGFDKFLEEAGLDEYPSVSTGTPIPNDWVLTDGTDPDGYTLLYNDDTVIPNFIPRSELLKLVTKRTITNSSTGGGQSPAGGEFLSCSLNEVAKWNDKPGVLEIDGFLCHKNYDPPTEVMDLGRVYDESYVEKLGRTIMKMRQAQSIQYELICKLDPTVCGFPPVRTIRVKESCQTNADLVFIGNSQGITIGSDEMVVSWDLWQIGYNPGTTTGYWQYPPADSILQQNPDGSALLISPPPQYIVVPVDYSGNGNVIIDGDTLQGTLVNTPNYVDVTNQNIPNNTWITVINDTTGETLSTWVDNGKVFVPDDFMGTITIIKGNDTLTGLGITDVPDRIELPLGYYPSNGNIFIDDTIPAYLQSDDTLQSIVSTDIYIDGDDTIMGAWPTISNNLLIRLQVPTRSSYLSLGRDARKVMFRGDGDQL